MNGCDLREGDMVQITAPGSSVDQAVGIITEITVASKVCQVAGEPTRYDVKIETFGGRKPFKVINYSGLGIKIQKASLAMSWSDVAREEDNA